jgi:putative membrane protein
MKHLMIFFSLAALLLAACGDNTTANKASNPAANPATDTAGGSTAASPETFIQEAAHGRNSHIEMSKLAASKATNPELKQFAQMMITDHTAAGKDLEELAKKKNLTVPADTGAAKPMIDKLNSQSGADFDRYYAEQAVQAHESDLRLYQQQAGSGSDADVKAFAAKAVPVIQKHLDAIKTIKGKMK